MSRIRLLDPLTANQIAAGEVVERPASVIKELLENSLDAGAQSVYLKIENGGKDKIIVTDDGFGMNADDMCLAFQRHATSKITTAEDLSQITTLGFRGEALASIAAVSRVHASSRQREDAAGTELKIEAGSVLSTKPSGCSEGTSIEISDLFFNAPARRKFLFNASRETAAISEIVNRLALSHPSVRFTYYSGPRLLLQTPGKGRLREVVASVYGLDLAEKLLEINYLKHDVELSGFLSPPQIHKATTSNIVFFINGRYIKDSILLNTIKEVYNSKIPGGRFPVAILNISIKPGSVDVNVHPQKLTVKFDRPEYINSVILAAVEDCLSRPDTDTWFIPQIGNDGAKQFLPNVEYHEPQHQVAWREVVQERSMDAPVEDPSIDVPKPEEAPANDLPMPLEESPAIKNDIPAAKTTNINASRSGAGIPIMRIVGQFKAGYILAEAEDGLYIIDQHGAHERILYDKYSQGTQLGHSQLTVPQTVDFSADEAEYLVEYIFLLQEFGFILEHFGGNSFILRGMPRFLNTSDGVNLLQDIVQLLASGTKVNQQDLEKELLLQLSCKGAIKEGQYLDKAEMEILIRQLAKTSYPLSCPHGRPIVIKLSIADLKKLFLRQE
ncbi:DNA mismatch repair endonuclease MutL [Metallumcola ferriviriculae]|uniref:DNA mismatch repair protein MutL n=1 Tax=Metallumcola ferriviriculae TaxID=3039180 RepID=A0AAU0USW6_9FIRM|nr:DNA mismatch repair endonuclease MutL [Desulfitibacteraceae bacterium MK1]